MPRAKKLVFAERLRSSRRISWCRGLLIVSCIRALYVYFGSKVEGSGNTFRSPCPALSIRFCGMTLPGNGVLLFCGSTIWIKAPLVSKEREKSPWRSAAVGKVRCTSELGDLRGRKSFAQKKNTLLRARLNPVPGNRTGPPKVKAGKS